jgi:hypothetical protein
VFVGFELLLDAPDLGEPVEHGREHASVSHGFHLLGQVTDANRPAAVDGAGIGLVLTREDPQKSRLTGAVRADEPPSSRARNHPRESVEQDARAEASLDAIDVNHGVAITTGPGPKDLGRGGPNPARTPRSDC